MIPDAGMCIIESFDDGLHLIRTSEELEPLFLETRADIQALYLKNIHENHSRIWCKVSTYQWILEVKILEEHTFSDYASKSEDLRWIGC